MKHFGTGSIQVPSEPDLTDEDVQDLVSALWENIDALPMPVQSLLHESTEPGKAGAVSYALAAGWAIGKFDYEHNDPWNSSKGGWVPKDNDVN